MVRWRILGWRLRDTLCMTRGRQAWVSARAQSIENFEKIKKSLDKRR